MFAPILQNLHALFLFAAMAIWLLLAQSAPPALLSRYGCEWVFMKSGFFPRQVQSHLGWTIYSTPIYHPADIHCTAG